MRRYKIIQEQFPSSLSGSLSGTEVAVYVLVDFTYGIKLYLCNMGLSSHVLALLLSFQEKLDKSQT